MLQWKAGSRMMRATALIALSGALFPVSAHAQNVIFGDALCPTPMEAPPGLLQLTQKMLTPGRKFALSGLSPDGIAAVARIQKELAARKARDWPALCQHPAKNGEVSRSGVRPRVIFMGDSITENWEKGDPGLFSATSLDRGISSQTTPPMVLRMYPDIIDLRPSIVHIIAGTNDISGNTGPVSDRTIVDNIRAMIVLAKANRIKVVLGSITPSTSFFINPRLNPSARIVRVDNLLRQLATEQQVVLVDYHARGPR